MQASHPAGFIQVGKTPFQLLAALPQELLAALAPNAPPVGVHRRLFFRLALPASSAPLRFRTVTAHPPLRHLRQHFIAVISLVQHHFFRSLGIHSQALAADGSDLFTRFGYRRSHGLSVASVCPR